MNTIYKSHNDSFSVKKRAGRGTSLLFLFLLSLLPLHAQTSPKHEVRAAWITAVYGLDWPRTKATTPAGIRRQKEELIDPRPLERGQLQYGTFPDSYPW